jgi:hypothetical protein
MATFGSGVPSYNYGAGYNSGRALGLPKVSKNAVLQGMLKRMVTTPAAPRVGGIPKLSLMKAPKAVATNVGKVPWSPTG